MTYFADNLTTLNLLKRVSVYFGWPEELSYFFEVYNYLNCISLKLSWLQASKLLHIQIIFLVADCVWCDQILKLLCCAFPTKMDFYGWMYCEVGPQQMRTTQFLLDFVKKSGCILFRWACSDISVCIHPFDQNLLSWMLCWEWVVSSFVCSTISSRLQMFLWI